MSLIQFLDFELSSGGAAEKNVLNADEERFSGVGRNSIDAAPFVVSNICTTKVTCLAPWYLSIESCLSSR